MSPASSNDQDKLREGSASFGKSNALANYSNLEKKRALPVSFIAWLEPLPFRQGTFLPPTHSGQKPPILLPRSLDSKIFAKARQSLFITQVSEEDLSKERHAFSLPLTLVKAMPGRRDAPPTLGDG